MVPESVNVFVPSMHAPTSSCCFAKDSAALCMYKKSCLILKIHWQESIATLKILAASAFLTGGILETWVTYQRMHLTQYTGHYRSSKSANFASKSKSMRKFSLELYLPVFISI